MARVDKGMNVFWVESLVCIVRLEDSKDGTASGQFASFFPPNMSRSLPSVLWRFAVSWQQMYFVTNYGFARYGDSHLRNGKGHTLDKGMICVL